MTYFPGINPAIQRKRLNRKPLLLADRWAGKNHLSTDIFICMPAESLQSFLILCDPIDCSLPGSSVHGILQARILEWVAILFSRGSFWPRDWTLALIPVAPALQADSLLLSHSALYKSWVEIPSHIGPIAFVTAWYRDRHVMWVQSVSWGLRMGCF